MNLRRSLSIVALSIVGLVLPARFAAAQDAVKIATVNPAKVFNEMQETKDLKQAMEAQRKGIEDEAKRRAAEVEEAKKQRDLFNPGTAEFQAKSTDLLKKAIEFQTWQELTKAGLARDQKLQMASLFGKIEAAAKEVAEAKKIDLVLVQNAADLPDIEQINVDQLRALINQRSVMYSNGKADITADVIAAVDAKYKKKP